MKRTAAYTLVWTATFVRTARKFLNRHPELRETFRGTLERLVADPNTPSLKLHALSEKLNGKHAVRLTYAYRIILILLVTEKEVVLLDIGSHDDVY